MGSVRVPQVDSFRVVRENKTVSTTFPQAAKKTRGYSIKEVEAFFAAARRAYDADEKAPGLTSNDIRHTAFAMVRKGYSTGHVDASLERLEDAFATRERERATAAHGEDAWFGRARTMAQTIVNRLARPAGKKFHHVSLLSVGYNRAEVDRFAGKLARYFEDGWPVTVDDVRTVVFRPQRGGYQEAQVDVVLDAVIDVMLAVR